MGVSFYFYLRDIDYKITEGIEGIVIFCIQLLFNFLWTPLFFWNKKITAALVDIAFLWCATSLNNFFLNPNSLFF
jgi:tryptophan-rich sensory protein